MLYFKLFYIISVYMCLSKQPVSVSSIILQNGASNELYDYLQYLFKGNILHEKIDKLVNS